MNYISRQTFPSGVISSTPQRLPRKGNMANASVSLRKNAVYVKRGPRVSIARVSRIDGRPTTTSAILDMFRMTEAVDPDLNSVLDAQQEFYTKK